MPKVSSGKEVPDPNTRGPIPDDVLDRRVPPRKVGLFRGTLGQIRGLLEIKREGGRDPYFVVIMPLTSFVSTVLFVYEFTFENSF